MTIVATVILWALAVAVCVPMVVVAVQCLIAVLTTRGVAKPQAAQRPSVAVLVPAHNEQGVIGRTLATILPQIRRGDRVLVVADNCTDETAAEAAAAGAEVLERQDAVNRGKGFALAAGIDRLRDDPRAIVVTVDADCTVEPGAIDALAAQAAGTGRPAQSIFLMYPPDAPGGPNVRNVVSSFAFMVKNQTRTLGMWQFGLPVPLTGSGMAFPWGVIRDAKLATGDIVEDLSLGLELTLRGRGTAPLLCPAARVISTLAATDQAMAKQRTRWEHGYLSVLLNRVPGVVAAGLRQRRPALAAVALDLAVPPLSLLVVLAAGVAGLCLGAGLLLGAWGPFGAVAAAILGLALGLGAAWARFGRAYLPAAAMLSIPLYVLWKLPIYLNFVRRREKQWVRTERNVSDQGRAV